MEQRVAALGWLCSHDDPSGQKANTARVVDYILNRKMAKDPQSDRYDIGGPDLLLGAVDLKQASEVVAAREQEEAEEVRDDVDAIAQGLGVPKRNLKAV